MEPITFTPLYQKRVWGGRNLATLYGRELPEECTPYGESWELSDREEDQSTVREGDYKGLTLHTLWQEKREELFGEGLPDSARFPLLIKILDAQEVLSVQVHPPTHLAAELQGEAKTEMWYIAHAEPDAKLYVGVKEGVSAETLQHAIETGKVEDCIHALSPKAGDSIHIDSGRLHAIGAGIVIYEIQQNSDTTYRVYDWNRAGLDGKPRNLHVEESLKCIDFTDVEPELNCGEVSTLSDCPYFRVEKRSIEAGQQIIPESRQHYAILTIISGTCTSVKGTPYKTGDFLLLPKGASPLTAQSQVEFLEVTSH